MNNWKVKIFIPILTLLSSIVYGQKPDVNELSVKRAPANVTVEISGSNFSSPLQVFFGGTQAQVLSSTDNLLEVRVPRGSLYDEIEVKNLTSQLMAKAPYPFMLSYGGGPLNPPQFDPQVDYSSESGLYDHCLCDFNRDGKLDIATANNNSNFINVFTNTSNTIGVISFVSSIIPVNTPTLNIKCADVNVDGRPDIVLSKSGNVTNGIVYLENTTTTAAISFATPRVLDISGTIARRIEVADLDLDGRPEIIVTNQSNNDINIFSKEPTSNDINSVSVKVPVTSVSTLSALMVEDLNGDKKPEIVVGQFLSANLYVLKNESTPGNISFGSPQNVAVPGFLTNIAGVDFDFDDDLDIVAVSFTDSKVVVVRNNSASGGGNIDLAAGPSFGVAVNPWGLDIVDINGDFRPDVLVSSVGAAPTQFTILENTSAGSFSINTLNIPVNDQNRNIKAGDVDNDGKPDIVIAGINVGFEKIAILRNANCFVPVITRTDDNVVRCADAPVNLVAIPFPNATYEWFRESGGTEISVKNSADPFLQDLPGAGTYVYRVEATSEGGACVTSSEPVNVEVVAGTVPQGVAISQTGPYCEGEPLVLTGSVTVSQPDLTYTWTLPDGTELTGQTLTIDPAELSDAGTYSLVVSNPVCAADPVDELVQVVSTQVEISVGGSTNICSNETVTLSVPNQAGSSYQWTKDGVDITGATGNSYDAGESGDFSVKIVTAENCNIDPTAVIVNAVSVPVPDFNAPASVCATQQVTFTDGSTVATGVNVIYSWDFGDGGSSTEQNPVYSFDMTGNYTVTLSVSYDGNCLVSVQKTIDVTSAPAFEISANGPLSFCEGESVTLTASDGFTDYLWDGTTPGQSLDVDQTRTYTVTADAGGGCEVSASADVTVIPLPEVTISASSTSVPPGSQVTLTASGAQTYEWAPIDIVDNTTGETTTATINETTTITVTGTSADNCQATAEITINTSIVSIDVDPKNSFSPNGDGTDDFWIIERIENYQDCTVSVFTRTGSLIFQKKGYANDWNAVFEGNDLPTGVYFYSITCDGSDATLKGSVLVAR